MIGQFQPKDNKPTVWHDVFTTSPFSDEDVQAIKEEAMTYAESIAKDFDPEKGIEKIKRHQNDKAKTISPLWKYWAADHSVTSKVDFDYSSNLQLQGESCRDKDVAVSDYEEALFAGSLMCCDTPERSVSFLLSTFCKEHSIGFSERLRLNSELTEYVYSMMAITFIYKNTINWARPADYERSIGRTKGVSKIPHPNHGSLSSGHSTVGQAEKKFLSKYAKSKGIALTQNWLNLCDEVGLARITVGIHWFVDHEAAIHVVEHYDEFVTEQLSLIRG